MTGGYANGCRSFYTAENTYTGWGSSRVTARAAVNWWMGSPGHKYTLLNTLYRQTGVAVAPGNADKAGGPR